MCEAEGNYMFYLCYCY